MAIRTIIMGIIFLGLCTSTKIALAVDKVYSPIVEKGELEIETVGSYDFDARDDKDAAQLQKYALGYGVTDRWATELYGEFEKEARDDDPNGFKFTEVEWENRYQLFEQGEYFIDAGLYLAYETSFEEHHADNIEGKVLLEKSFSHFTHTANIIFDKAVGGHSHASEVDAGLAWSTKYRLNPKFEPGFEYHADFGEMRRHIPYEDQEHMAGPVFYGQLGSFKYDVGYLFGITDPTPQGTLKWIIEWEKHF